MSRKEKVEILKALIAENPEGYVEQRLQDTVDKIMDVAHEPVVRVVTMLSDDMLNLMEMLPGGAVLEIHRNSNGILCFDILPPKAQEDKKQWCDNMAKELELNGFNTTRAPRWIDE